MGKYEVYFDTIGFMLDKIAQGQHEHSFAIIPELAYRDWKELVGFNGEMSELITGTDGVEREFLTASLTDEGHDWRITTTTCRHPNPRMGDDWRFILQIKKDGEEYSHSQMSTEDFLAYVAQERD